MALLGGQAAGHSQSSSDLLADLDLDPDLFFFPPQHQQGAPDGAGGPEDESAAVGMDLSALEPHHPTAAAGGGMRLSSTATITAA